MFKVGLFLLCVCLKTGGWEDRCRRPSSASPCFSPTFGVGSSLPVRCTPDTLARGWGAAPVVLPTWRQECSENRYCPVSCPPGPLGESFP